MAAPPDAPAPLWRRLLWFATLYGASLLALGLVASVLRAWLRAG
ncbi:hypothetical protein M446_4325 [Methylobacterium sp. 4-46]|nr:MULTISPECIES: DUF2474 family protein [unclassified Methylobacterium]ACA18668.1 hypothetical protein M446_4325 [Methylobacterium sp. 4-46]